MGMKRRRKKDTEIHYDPNLELLAIADGNLEPNSFVIQTGWDYKQGLPIVKSWNPDTMEWDEK